MAIPITITIPTPPPGESVVDLLALHSRISRLIDSSMMSDDVMDHLVLAAGNLRFDIAHAPSRNLAEVAAKVEFFFRDYLDVGECEVLAHAMRACIRADLERLEAAHV